MDNIWFSTLSEVFSKFMWLELWLTSPIHYKTWILPTEIITWSTVPLKWNEMKAISPAWRQIFQLSFPLFSHSTRGNNRSRIYRSSLNPIKTGLFRYRVRLGGAFLPACHNSKLAYAKNFKFGMEVASHYRSKKSCSINNGCHGYLVTSSQNVKIWK